MKQHKYSLIEILFNIIFACFVIFCRLSSFCVQFLSPLTEPVILVYQVSVSLGKWLHQVDVHRYIKKEVFDENDRHLIMAWLVS